MSEVEVQKRWEEAGVFEPEVDETKPKFYLTVAYPYPSGSMHVGHGRTYTVPDVIARFKRMCGYNVLLPMAWHVTGTPVIGISKRIEKGDKQTLELYGKLYRVPEETLKSFVKPEEIVKHFSAEYKRNMKDLGLSIDWSREFTTTTPHYQRFIEWQYRRLRKLGFVRKGKHPVRYCPSCDNPVGDHDLLKGEGATIQEFTLIKFSSKMGCLPAATLRPETIYGVTNLWVNPASTYVEAIVEGERWTVSKKAAEKLRFLGRSVKVRSEFRGENLVGVEVKSPITNEVVPVLPASFVDDNIATGVVMSVPAHAPYDWVALQESNAKLEPKLIIRTPGFEETPAKQVVEKLGIRDQRDKKLEEATEILYREEFLKGVMTVGDYKDVPVPSAREAVKRRILEEGLGDVFYEFSQRPVVCRCGSECVVKVLKDQWFLLYSSEKWKRKARRCLKRVKLVPEELRESFEYYLDWLKDWACARRVGLGTRLPWDPKWVVEPLSDSTIYMAYYTISKRLQRLDAERLSDEVFDYVFLGKGDPVEIGELTGIPKGELEAMRREFLYWYPPDWRLSAKDLIGNHLIFHLFHHAAVFKEEHWPKGIVVFGMALLGGEKMSSSKGNVVLLQEALEWGGDLVRLCLLAEAEPWQDFEWREEALRTYERRLEQFRERVEFAFELEDEGVEERCVDRWLRSKLHLAIEATREALETFQVRKALQHCFFDLLRSWNWYFKRAGEPNPKLLKEFADCWLRLMAPFIPFSCEELWAKLGKEGFAATAPYPEPRPEFVDEKALVGEEMIRTLLEDVKEIQRVVKLKPKRVHLYLAPAWKREVMALAASGKSVREILKERSELKSYASEVAKLVKRVVEEKVEAVLSAEEEKRILEEAKPFLERELEAEVVLQERPTYDPENRAKIAVPMRPGIYLE